MTVDPYNLDPAQFKQEVRKAVKGATNPKDAEEKIKKHFSPQPQVWVKVRGKHHFGALVQQKPGAENVDITCKR